MNDGSKKITKTEMRAQAAAAAVRKDEDEKFEGEVTSSAEKKKAAEEAERRWELKKMAAEDAEQKESEEPPAEQADQATAQFAAWTAQELVRDWARVRAVARNDRKKYPDTPVYKSRRPPRASGAAAGSPGS